MQDITVDIHTKLLRLDEALSDPKIYFMKDDRYFLDTGWISEFFKLLVHYKPLMLNSDNLTLTLKFNNLVVFMLTNIKVKAGSSLKIGQMTFNALGGTEHNIYYSFPQIDYYTNKEDHEYIKTGWGVGKPDFIMNEDLVVKAKDPQGNIIDLCLKKGMTIDAKDYWDEVSADRELKKNTTGALGHYGNGLLYHLLKNDKFYYTDNIAGAICYELIDFKPKAFRRQYRLELDAEGILEVTYFSTYNY